jgi:hypothetical protein
VNGRQTRSYPLAQHCWLLDWQWAVGSFFCRKSHVLTDKDTIVLADFKNATDDAVFDGTLRLWARALNPRAIC